MHRVFVYGTLKKGARNSGFMATANFIGEAETDACWKMVRFASFHAPGRTYPAVEPDGNGRIAGEIYEIDDATLRELDVLEGVGERYDRRAVFLSDGSKAMMYVSIDKARAPLDNGSCVAYDPEKKVYSWLDEMDGRNLNERLGMESL